MRSVTGGLLVAVLFVIELLISWGKKDGDRDKYILYSVQAWLDCVISRDFSAIGARVLFHFHLFFVLRLSM